ncbi:hypothetical protein DPMN_052928 [Dreissena polymorpha]|uniref:Uncharacterized protein n=1 Tax=Dreissena polymorpha TaxID=45954 RepID=A0A9D4CLS4_DREPO|nr:hypothetical protein DPMN_052928 [Dreissena polymorpha]
MKSGEPCGPRKNAPPTGGHVFQATGTTFKLVANIIGTNLLTKLHDDRTINMASRVLTRKNATPPWRPYIIGTIHLTKLHDNRTINVASRVLTRKMPRPLVAMFFKQPKPFFELIQDIIRTNLLTKFHEDWKINVASRVLTRKNAPPPGSHVFQPTSIIFELVQDIFGVNLLTKFHEDRTINVASRVLTRFYYSHIRKNAPPLGSHVFQANVTIFELIQDIIETNLLTKFHEDWTINVASRVFTMFYYSHKYSHIRKNAPPLGSHVFQANVTIFELMQDIIETNLPTKFHEDWTINVAFRVLTRKTPPPPGGHVFSPIWTIFESIRDINEINVLTKYHDDWAKIVTSRVFTRNTAPPPGSHTNILTNNVKIGHQIFELSRGINGTNVLTKFHEDQTINVAPRVFTKQNVDDGRRTTDKKRSQKGISLYIDYSVSHSSQQ